MRKTWISDAIEPTPAAFHDALERTLMRLPEKQRVRAHLPIGRIVLVTVLTLILLCSGALGTRSFDVNWFLQNRKAEPTEVDLSKTWSVSEILYGGLFLTAELNDVVWDKDMMSLSLSFSMAGASDDVLTVYNMNIGVDGVRHDHIWTKDGIIPVDEWADGRTVYTYAEDVWRVQGYPLTGTSDSLIDGKGETFLAEFDFSWVNPDRYADLLDADGLMTLSTEIFVKDYATGETIEQAMLTVRISAPSMGEWRKAYDDYWM